MHDGLQLHQGLLSSIAPRLAEKDKVVALMSDVRDLKIQIAKVNLFLKFVSQLKEKKNASYHISQSQQLPNTFHRCGKWTNRTLQHPPRQARWNCASRGNLRSRWRLTWPWSSCRRSAGTWSVASGVWTAAPTTTTRADQRSLYSSFGLSWKPTLPVFVIFIDLLFIC